MSKPTISIWTTSQYPYDQRIQRIAHTMESMGAEVAVYDRKTPNHPEGRITTQRKSGPFMYFGFNRQIAHLVDEEPTDVVYAADIDVMPGLMWGMRGTPERKVVLDLHEWFPEVIELKNNPIKKAIWRWIELQSVNFAASHMTVNHSLKQIFEELYGKEFTVVRNVPEMRSLHYVDPRIRLNNKILYYQGAINAGRGLEEVILILPSLPDWKLWLVGEGDITEEILELAVANGVEDRVVLHGRKHPEELPDLAGQATVGLNLLSHNSRSYYYSLANKYFDYIHAGLPSIHMDFPEYRKLLFEHEVGTMVGEMSAETIVNAIVALTRDKTHYVNMIRQCESAKSIYNWEIESKKLVNLLTPLIRPEN